MNNLADYKAHNDELAKKQGADPDPMAVVASLAANRIATSLGRLSALAASGRFRVDAGSDILLLVCSALEDWERTMAPFTSRHDASGGCARALVWIGNRLHTRCQAPNARICDLASEARGWAQEVSAWAVGK